MNKPVSKQFAAFLMVLLVCIITAQEVETPQFLTVIATLGLNLRDNPSLESKVIDKIPYGGQLFLIDENYENIRDLLDNDWAHVTFDDKTGYVASRYVAPYYYDFPTEKIDPNYALLFPMCTCLDNFQYESNFKWFAICADSDDKLSIEPASISYHYQKATIGNEVCIDVESKNKPDFVIGSNQTISVKDGIYNSQISKNTEIDLAALNKDVYYESDINELIYCYDNRDINLSDQEMHFQSVVWRGDLNNDDVEDFIFSYGVKMARNSLVLSEKIGKEVQFKTVASFYFGYCC